jgi:ubiquinone/menaquinone biosynthesis C-methylase UbiE
MKTNKAIEHNIRVHDSIYKKYEQMHGEIFNPIEQERLFEHLLLAKKYIKTSSIRKEALDYGCGSGNLTQHMIKLDFHVISADISVNFLTLIKERYNHTGQSNTLKTNGQDLSNITNNRFDFVATYSVLHHVPDYLKIIEEMVRVTKPGGIIYIDNEANELYWNSKSYSKFLRLVQPKKDWKRFLRLSSYINKIRKIINPRFEAGGDIHVYPDDHIEWNKIENLLKSCGCEIVFKEDYLMYRKEYPIAIYEAYKNKVKETRVLIARKK